MTTTVTIDPNSPPDRLCLDAGVVIRALGWFADATSDDCRRLLLHLQSKKLRITVAAPALAEILRVDPATRLPNVRFLEPLALDLRAAELCGEKMPKSAFDEIADLAGYSRTVVKVDAMIVAAAKRHGAPGIVQVNRKDFPALSSRFDIPCWEPAMLLPPPPPPPTPPKPPAQGPLPGLT